MTKEIGLTRGYVALVDDEDYEWLSQWKWHAAAYSRGQWYAIRLCLRGECDHSNGRKWRHRVWMHRVLMNAPGGLDVDHINGNTLDYRRENLRICSQADNNKNVCRRRDNRSGYRGVYWNKEKRRWCSLISCDGIRIYLGAFDDVKDAARAYNAAAIEHHGEFARLNDV